MSRILFFVVIAFLVWLAVRVAGGNRKRNIGPPPLPEASLAPSEAIRQCAWCGVHVPVGQATTLPDGRLYCSDAHRDAAIAASNDSARV